MFAAVAGSQEAMCQSVNQLHELFPEAPRLSPDNGDAVARCDLRLGLTIQHISRAHRGEFR